MTELETFVYGSWYALGRDAVPNTTLMWDPNSFLRKGVSTASIVSSSPAVAAMQGMAATNNTTSPVSSGIAPGYATGYNITPSFFVVPSPTHPRQPVFVYKESHPNPFGTGFVPDAWTSGETYPGGTTYPSDQQAYCVNVPVPLGGDGVTSFDAYYGRPLEDNTGDHHLTIYDPWNDEMWDFEFFCTLKVGTTTQSWRQATSYAPPTGYTTSDGYYYGCAQPGYIGHLLGTSVASGNSIQYGGPGNQVHLPDGSFAQVAATSIALVAGTITPDDIMRTQIPHMLQGAINCGSGHIAPAIADDTTPQRSQLNSGGGFNNDFTYVGTEGAIFRLDPTYTLPPLGDLISAHSELCQAGLGSNPGQVITPLHLMIWTAMQQYGLLVTDFGSNTLQITSSQAVGTPYSDVSLSAYNARIAALGWVSGPGNAYGTAPWSKLQQVVYPF